MTESAVQQHFMTLYYPGSFFAETSSVPVDNWDLTSALRKIRQDHNKGGWRPWAFSFTTRGRSAEELDSKVTETSGTYFLGGEIFSFEQIEAMGKGWETLLSNMKNNKYDHVIRTSAGSYQPFNVGEDVLLEWS